MNRARSATVPIVMDDGAACATCEVKATTAPPDRRFAGESPPPPPPPPHTHPLLTDCRARAVANQRRAPPIHGQLSLFCLPFETDWALLPPKLTLHMATPPPPHPHHEISLPMPHVSHSCAHQTWKSSWRKSFVSVMTCPVTWSCCAPRTAAASSTAPWCSASASTPRRRTSPGPKLR